MSFWSDATPITKGAIVIGGILIVGLLVFWLGGFGGSDEPTTEQRGLPPPSEASQ